ncbi:MAG: sodium:alanine symporter family protein [Clostridia bacterium]|nr:sodium:alanine symporter family protein [Clostridia bacterium]
MEGVQSTLLNIVGNINSYLTDYVLIFLLVGIGLYFSIRTKFVQIRCFGEGMKKTFGGLSLKGKKQKGGLSSFQAFTTAVAAQVGTGNIVGACGAILIGGPGAIFWMWIIAFFGMATIYGEAVVAQKTRIVNEDGSVTGGPVYYIRTAFKNKFGKFLAGFFAVSVILALGFMGTMVQSNSISESCNNAFGIDGWIIGIVLCVIAGFIFIGGLQRIGSFTEKVVPIMAVLYILGSIVVLCIRFEYIGSTFALIFKCAFKPMALVGGGIGTAISQGAKRGLFSNEAGMGSTPHAHALANVKKPHDQGVVAMIGVFIDTFIVLTMTALVVISTMFTKGGALYNVTSLDGLDIEKTNLAQKAFSSAFGSDSFGQIFIAVCLLFFAFSTIIGWNLFGRINMLYLFGKKANLIYSILAIAFIFLGTVLKNDLVWELTDMFNNIMVLPNVIALACFGALVAKESKKQKDINL